MIIKHKHKSYLIYVLTIHISRGIILLYYYIYCILKYGGHSKLTVNNTDTDILVILASFASLQSMEINFTYNIRL